MSPRDPAMYYFEEADEIDPAREAEARATEAMRAPRPPFPHKSPRRTHSRRQRAFSEIKAARERAQR